MTKRVSVKNHHLVNNNINWFVTPELRKQIVRLKQELDDCQGRLSDHFYVMNEIQEALTMAQECAQCLLTSDPFAAWETLKNSEEEFDDLIEDAPGPSIRESKEPTRIYEAKGTVTKLVTSEMRRRILELKGQLDEYATCLREAFDNMLELESLNRAVGLADEIQCVDQLESWEPPKKREQQVSEENESLGDL